MKALFRLFFAVLGFAVFPAFAIDDMVCARNYMAGDHDSPCHRKLAGYAFVEHLDTPEIRVCTKKASSFFCSQAPKEYRWVVAESGKQICTADFNQPSVANYCKDLPALYSYVQAAD